MFKKFILVLFLISLIVGNVFALSGTYTTNSYFYLPGYGSFGALEYQAYNAAMEVADNQIEANKDAVITEFTGLNDTPANYTDQAGKYVKVNAGEDALEYGTPGGGGTVTTSGTPVANDIARFIGATVIEGLSYTEFKAALDLEIDTDIQAYDAALAIISGLTYVSPSFIKLTANDTYAVRTLAEVKTDLSLNNVENTALSTWAGTENITTLGTIVTGTWQGTAIADSYIPDNITITNNALTTDKLSVFAATTEAELYTVLSDVTLFLEELKDDITPEYGGPMDHNNERDTEVKTVEFNGLYDNGNSGATPTINWQNGNYQKIAVSENTLFTFSNAFIGTITLQITYSGAYTAGFNAGYTILEEGGTELSFTGTLNAVDILKVMYLGTANNYVVGVMLDVKD